METPHALPKPHVDYDRFRASAPEAAAALAALGRAVDETGLEKTLTELVKVRVSQINGCAFCLQFHLNLARKLEIEAGKLDLVAVWREAPGYSARERAALAWAEHLSGMNRRPIPEDAYAALRDVFSEAEATNLTVSVATINAWNRIAGGLAFTPPRRT